MRRQFFHRLICLLLGLVMLLLPAAVLHAQAVEWQMATEYPSNSMPGEGLRFFADTLSRESGGRIILKGTSKNSL